MQKQIQFKLLGMQRDLSAAMFNPQYAYENKNIRIISSEENTVASVINEKGNKYSPIGGVPMNTLLGTPIGTAVIDNNLIVFVQGNKEFEDLNIPEEVLNEEYPDLEEDYDIETISDDKIYKLWFDEDDNLQGEILYSGLLNFDYKHPIETLVFYENSEIQKVYWVDGLNQLRVINTSASDEVKEKWNNQSFDFRKRMKFEEIVTISRIDTTNGMFDPGVVQYVLTYFNRYNAESNIFYTSPLYYASHADRGGNPEEKVACSFSIKIDNLDNKNFDYIRIYSIVRTSIDAAPTVKVVADLNIQDVNTITYVDGNLSGYIISSTDLLYKQVQEIVANTFTQKDNTLFIGDFSTPNSTIDEDIINYFRSEEVAHIEFSNEIESLERVYANNYYYAYGHQLKNNSFKIKTFKYGETYRFGLQFQKYNGVWSESVWITDAENTVHIDGLYSKSSEVKIPKATFTISKDTGIPIIQKLISQGYVNVRPVIVYPSFQDRTVVCQGVLCPTVFNVADRASNSPFVQSSWFFRPDAPYDVYLSTGQPLWEKTPSWDTLSVYDRYETYVNRDYDVTNITIGLTPDYDTNGKDSKSGIMHNGKREFNNSRGYLDGEQEEYERDTKTIVSNFSEGTWLEFRDLYPIPDERSRRAEIQGILDPPKRPFTVLASIDMQGESLGDLLKPDEWLSNNSDNWYIDRSIVTFHSPDIEWDDNIRNLDLDTSDNYELRIVGIVPLTAFAGDLDIQTETPANNYKDSSAIAPGFYKRTQKSVNFSRYGFKCMASGAFWFDEITNRKTENPNLYPTGFIVYPFHRNGSLNNTVNASESGYKSAKLSTKKLSNLRYSYNSLYFDESDYGDNFKSGTYFHSRVALFDSNEVTPIKLKTYLTSTISKSIDDFVYYGNVDKINTFSVKAGNKAKGYPIAVGMSRTDGNRISQQEGSLQHYYDNYDNTLVPGWENINSGYYTGWGLDDFYGIVLTDDSDENASTEPVRIKYNSTPHFVIDLGSDLLNREILPVLKDKHESYFWKKYSDKIGTDEYYGWGEEFYMNTSEHVKFATNWIKQAMKFSGYPSYDIGAFYALLEYAPYSSEIVMRKANSESTNVYFAPYWYYTNGWYETYQIPSIFCEERKIDYNFPIELSGDVSGSAGYGFLWLGEVRRKVVNNRFGGNSNEALEQNTWYPCGESVPLINIIDGDLTITYREGDTYYQRYDNLKTYPASLEDQNCITDIVSFMCETHINIDGRYDRNRGLTSNITITPTNFNLLNKVYTQTDNYFSYTLSNPNRVYLNEFRNSISWSLTKTAGEDIDSWTDMTLASTLDLDGDKGYIRALRVYRNNILAFQDKAISQILYNENVQLQSTEGLPIEIANSGKVSGKRVLWNETGVVNKWSICVTQDGVFFIDDINKNINLLSNQMSCISDTSGFHTWIKANIKDLSIWNPVDFENFVTYYDTVNDDVLFISKDYCLAYSTSIGKFVSFYSYNGVPYINTIQGRGIELLESRKPAKWWETGYKTWLRNEGDYNMYFDEYDDFYVTIIANPDPHVDKIFNNINMRTDTWDSEGNLLEETFDTLKVWNEYQEREIGLTRLFARPSNLKKKFRIWRINIPRDNKNKRDRMRNPWLYIKLSKEIENTNKTLLHDIVVDYFE